jgi:hypothetical protein
MILDCRECEGNGYTGDVENWEECTRCRGIGQLSDDCSGGHIHCVDVEVPDRPVQVLCIDCMENLGVKTEVYSRVVGYLRPVSGWNKGKVAEFAVRKTYNITKGIEDADKTGA